MIPAPFMLLIEQERSFHCKPMSFVGWELPLFFCPFRFNWKGLYKNTRLFVPTDHCHIIILKVFFLPDGLVQMCLKPVTNHKKVKDHAISVLGPLSSHVYCHQKVRPEKHGIRLMNGAECVAVKERGGSVPQVPAATSQPDSSCHF